MRRQPLLGFAKCQPFERVDVVEEVGGGHELVVAVASKVQPGKKALEPHLPGQGPESAQRNGQDRARGENRRSGDASETGKKDRERRQGQGDPESGTARFLGEQHRAGPALGQRQERTDAPAGRGRVDGAACRKRHTGIARSEREL
jgi:hypothetical protein